ncbi:MAG: hypothetical protein HPY59_03835 [Anaerolineae bacterium]|nr:hypothetical protein [Anaerolineae bacterium]
MKHFIVDIRYTAPIEKIEQIVAQHRQYLQFGFDQGWLLFSGPKNPRTGGVVVARFPSHEEMEVFFKQDPYCINGCAEYTFTEFNPVKYQAWLKDWITAE